jgi:sulfur carrier protein
VISVQMNGQPRQLEDGSTVEDVIMLTFGQRSGLAVAVNGEVVPRSSWTAVRLGQGDRLEVLSAAQGG